MSGKIKTYSKGSSSPLLPNNLSFSWPNINVDG